MQTKKIPDEVAVLGLIIGMLLMVILGGWILAKMNDDDSSDKEKLHQSCYYYSKRLVEDNLKSPKSADFPLYSESFITDKGDTVIVSAYVDADNSFGANVRTYYEATIEVSDGTPVRGSVVFK